MSSWRDRKYGGQGNRAPRGTTEPRNHAEDGHCHCNTLRAALAAGQVTTITTFTGIDGKQHPIPDQETARQVKNRAYSCGQLAGVSLVMSEDGLGLVQLGDSRWGFRFRPVDPASAKTHVDKLITSGQREKLAYDHVKGEQRPRRRTARQQEAEQVEAHRPLARAVSGFVHHGDSPGPVPEIPPAPPGFDALTGRRLRKDESRIMTPGGESLGIGSQTLLELMRARLEREEQPVIVKPRSTVSGEDTKTVIGDLIDRWKTGKH